MLGYKQRLQIVHAQNRTVNFGTFVIFSISPKYVVIYITHLRRKKSEYRPRLEVATNLYILIPGGKSDVAKYVVSQNQTLHHVSWHHHLSRKFCFILFI